MLRTRATAAIVAGIVPLVALGPPTSAASAHMTPARNSSTSVRTSPAFRIATRQHFGQAANASGYSVIVVTGRKQAWVFGGTNPGGLSAPVAERWNGTHAEYSALPPGLTGFISDASAPAATDIWAASEYGRYVLNWNGTRWRVVRQWQTGMITGLTAIDAHDVWVFGTTATGFTSLGTRHFNGQSWTVIRGRARSIYRASAISRRDIWAIAAGRQADIIMRFSGRWWWRMRRSGGLLGMRPHDILALSNHDVWIVGNSTSKSAAGRLVLTHWNGSAWTTIVTRLNAWAGRLARGPHGGVLITATPIAASATGLVLRASATGRLSLVRIRFGAGSGVSDVVLAGGGHALWAIGGLLTRLGADAAIWVGRIAPSLSRLADYDD
jgi:hypothetical protein